MAIYKRRDSKFYWVSFQYKGKPIQQSTGETSIKKARIFEDLLRRQLRYSAIGVEGVVLPAAPIASRPNYVYLMLDERNGYIKIGRSTNPDRRESTLQSEQPATKLLHKWMAEPQIEV